MLRRDKVKSDERSGPNGPEQSADDAGVRRFVLHFTLAFVLLCAVVLGLNVLVNPYGIYGTHWLKPVVWSDRREKLELLRSFPGRTDLLVLGSSRMMRVNPSALGDSSGLEGFNLSVNHARTEDFLALLRYSVLKLELKPKVVVVGLDIHAFRGFYEADNLLKYYPELAYYIDSERMNPLFYSIKVDWVKFTKGLSYQQLEMSGRALQRYFSTGAWQEVYQFAGDGTLVFNSQEQAAGGEVRDTLELSTALNAAVTQYSLEFEGFGGISDTRLLYFQRLAAFCRGHGIRLVAVILPYHPELLKRLHGSAFERLNREWEARMVRMTALEGVTLVNALDIATFRGNPALFYDEIHMLPENSNRLARYVAACAGLGERHAF